MTLKYYCEGAKTKTAGNRVHSFSPEAKGPGGRWFCGWREFWCGWVGCGMEVCWGKVLGCSRPCRTDRPDPDELRDKGGLWVAPTPVMAGSASKMSLARDSAKSPPPPRSSTSKMTVLLSPNKHSGKTQIFSESWKWPVEWPKARPHS